MLARAHVGVARRPAWEVEMIETTMRTVVLLPLVAEGRELPRTCWPARCAPPPMRILAFLEKLV